MYHPFGMQMPGRKYTQPNSNYRYGFNGKENDKDISEGGQDYGERIYDGRIGKFLSVDPLTIKYPWYTPYQFAGNTPIQAIDLDGLEPSFHIPNGIYKAATKTVVRKSKEVISGVGNILLGMIGLITQVPAAMHYGDNIQLKEWETEFPSIPNNNIFKDLVLPVFTSPIELGKKIKENPKNGESWGEVLGIVLLYRQGGKIVKGKPSNWGLVDVIDKHLSRDMFRTLNNEMDAGNVIMIQRMRDIQAGRLEATEIDVNFANHELTEFYLMEHEKMSYPDAHAESLKRHGIKNDKAAAGKIYTKEALDASDKQMRLEYENPKK